MPRTKGSKNKPKVANDYATQIAEKQETIASLNTEIASITANIDTLKADLKEKKSDEDGYMSWDVEHWSAIDKKRFIRCYSLEGRVLSESTGHNIYDLYNEFKPEDALKVELS